MLNRRGFLIGLGALIAAPAIVRAGIIMPINPTLILPDKIEVVTFPIEGRAWFRDGAASFEGDVWTMPTNLFPDDSVERWLRLKKRHETKFAEIYDKFGQAIGDQGTNG